MSDTNQFQLPEDLRNLVEARLQLSPQARFVPRNPEKLHGYLKNFRVNITELTIERFWALVNVGLSAGAKYESLTGKEGRRKVPQDILFRIMKLYNLEWEPLTTSRQGEVTKLTPEALKMLELLNNESITVADLEALLWLHKHYRS